MRKKEMIDRLSEKTGLSKKDVRHLMSEMLDLIVETVANGERVQLTGFGTFEQRTRAARVGRNPQTGEEIQIPERTHPAFKPGKAFKESV